MIEIRLSKAELIWAEWAIAPMEDFWKEQINDGSADKIPSLPSIRKNVLRVPCDDDVIEDFLYRLEVQAVDITDEEALMRATRNQSPELLAGAMKKPIISLAKKIRKATSFED